jgi:hypothetical protein
MNLDLESKMDFDYSVGTEDRFALRRWFGQFIEAQNKKALSEFEPFLSDQLMVKGFTDNQLSRQQYLDYLQLQLSGNKTLQVRFPNVKVKFKGFLFYISGSFEAYIDGILSFDGSMDIKIMKEDEGFKVVYIELFPRMMLSPKAI